MRDAARTFIDSFDASNDRVACSTFGNGARCSTPMPAGRGFDKATRDRRHADRLPGGSTTMVEGLYRGWDELRSVPIGQQSGLRVIVLFTDGASNSVPGIYDAGTGVAKGVSNVGLPEELAPTRTTRRTPARTSMGLYQTDTGAPVPRLTVHACPLEQHQHSSRRCRGCR